MMVIGFWLVEDKGIMKNSQQFNTYSLDEANTLVQRDFSTNYWVFITQNMNYPEIKYDTDNGQITCPGFIPFKDLALEVISDLERKKDDIKKCQVCHMYFDVNKEDGIFGDPDNLERFICGYCSKKISAKEFYEKFMVM
jgi:hypothetical protein